MKINRFRVAEGMLVARSAFQKYLPAHSVQRIAFCLALQRIASEEIQRLIHLDNGAYEPVINIVQELYSDLKED